MKLVRQVVVTLPIGTASTGNLYSSVDQNTATTCLDIFKCFEFHPRDATINSKIFAREIRLIVMAQTSTLKKDKKSVLRKLLFSYYFYCILVEDVLSS
jgi:hypothetical protein